MRQRERVEMMGSRLAGRVVIVVGCTVVFLGLGVPQPALGQETEIEMPEVGNRWSNEAQLAYVRSSGNTAAATLAVSNRFTYNWDYAELVAYGEAYRTTSTERQLFNEGGLVREESVNRLAAERYELGAKFRRNVLGNVFWYVGAGWYRNQPAGIDSRTSGNGGIGYRFVESASTLLVVEGGVGVTRETPVDGVTDTFADGRVAMELRRSVGDNAELAASGEVLQNLQNTADRRMNMRAALTASVSRTLALRFSWDVKYDADPPLLLIDHVPGEAAVPYLLGTTDHTIGASLVVSF